MKGNFDSLFGFTFALGLGITSPIEHVAQPTGKLSNSLAMT